MLSADRMEHLRQELLNEQAQLRRDLANLQPDQLSQDTNAGVGNHPAEDALLTETQEQIVAMRRHQERQLERVEDALKRMDNETYGACERCGRDIDFARLEAQPQVTLCLNCQRLIEQ
jgi:RNA polymerase-binding protein DksA